MYLVYQYWNTFLIYFVAVSIGPGIKVVGGLENYIFGSIIFFVLLILLPKGIEFLKLNVNFVSLFLIGSFACIGYMYLLRYALVGIVEFSSFPAAETLFGISGLRGIAMSELQVLVFNGVLLMLLSLINDWLGGL